MVYDENSRESRRLDERLWLTQIGHVKHTPAIHENSGLKTVRGREVMREGSHGSAIISEEKSITTMRFQQQVKNCCPETTKDAVCCCAAAL